MHRLPCPQSFRASLRAPSIRTHTSTIRAIHTTNPRHGSGPSFFNLAALSNSRETHALSKASGLGLLNHSTALQQLDAESRAHLPLSERGATGGKETSSKTQSGDAGVKSIGVGEGAKILARGRALRSGSSPLVARSEVATSPTATSAAPVDAPKAIGSDEIDSKLAIMQIEQDAKMFLLAEQVVAANDSWFRGLAIAATGLAVTYLVLYTDVLGKWDLSQAAQAIGFQSKDADHKQTKKPKPKKSSQMSRRVRKESQVPSVPVKSSSKPDEKVPNGLSWLWQASSSEGRR